MSAKRHSTTNGPPKWLFWCLITCVLFLCIGCSASAPATPQFLATAPTSTPVLVVGDSLSAHYQMPEEQGWVALLEQRMHEQQWLRADQGIANASVSGQTSEGGLRILQEQLDAHQPVLVVIELGANDALRRQNLRTAQKNLQQMITMVQHTGAQVMVLGVDLPATLFFVSTNDLDDMYQEVGKNVVLVPNILKNVNNNEDLMLGDRLHPNAKGQPLILDHVWKGLLHVAAQNM